ncbi:MAG TPA: TetR/AcrR family transcriptional regulator [Streptosporangiaceae bacterium]|nr:TetR/AcrR family transcriptional regulator [Streptosporangiaceae bacterium]
MPRVVDHENRRHELAEAAWRVIVKHGLDGTTTRLIARESGYSNGVLAHYFESKDEILLEALRISHDGVDKRIRVAVDEKGGLDALRTFCIEVLPISEQSARETHLEMSMWSRALVNDELRSVQRSESSRWRRLLEGLIVDAQRSGELVEMPPRTFAVLLSAVIDGLSIYALLYPDRFGKAELIGHLDDFFAAFHPSGVATSSEAPPAPTANARPRSRSTSRQRN